MHLMILNFNFCIFINIYRYYIMKSFKNEAVNIIKNNSRGDFTIPCSKLYPFQWNWDSAFCALGIYTYDKQRAIREIDMLFKGQWDNGMIPQIIFHKESNEYYPGPDIWDSKTTPKTSCITQPPIITTVLWYLINMGFNDNIKINDYYQNLLKYHKWFVNERDPYNNGLISIFHPWETGRDNSPEWDEPLQNINIDNSLIIQRKDDILIDDSERPTNDDYNRYMQIVFNCKELKWDNKKIYDEGLFNVCDPGIQFIFIRACKDLYKIASYLNKDDDLEMIESWINLYTKGCEKLWNEDKKIFTSLNLKNNKLYHKLTCGSILFCFANINLNEKNKYMINNSKKILKNSNYIFPSFDPSEIIFDRKKYWRGPIWCIINFMLYIGFKKCYEIEVSNKLKKTTMKLIENNGFYEYYDPIDGNGCGGDNFSWTASIYLLFNNNLFD